MQCLSNDDDYETMRWQGWLETVGQPHCCFINFSFSFLSISFHLYPDKVDWKPWANLTFGGRERAYASSHLHGMITDAQVYDDDYNGDDDNEVDELMMTPPATSMAWSLMLRLIMTTTTMMIVWWKTLKLGHLSFSYLYDRWIYICKVKLLSLITIAVLISHGWWFDDHLIIVW